jgi:hypothetical protein
VRRRFFAALALAAAVITGTTGCTLSAEIATMKEYDPSDGVGRTWETLPCATFCSLQMTLVKPTW